MRMPRKIHRIKLRGGEVRYHIAGPELYILKISKGDWDKRPFTESRFGEKTIVFEKG